MRPGDTGISLTGEPHARRVGSAARYGVVNIGFEHLSACRHSRRREARHPWG